MPDGEFQTGNQFYKYLILLYQETLMCMLAESIRKLITLVEKLDKWAQPPEKNMREQDFDLEWFKEHYAHVKSYHFTQSQDRMATIFNIDSAAHVMLQALGDTTSRPPAQHPGEPLQQVLAALNLTQDQSHSGYTSGHSEHAFWWYHLENTKAGFGLFYMARSGRVFQPDVWYIGAHDAKTVAMVAQLFKDAGIFPDPTDTAIRRKENQAKRLAQQLPALNLKPGMIHSDDGVEFEILGTTPTGMVKVKFITDHWKYPAGTVVNMKPTQIKKSKLREPSGITPAEALRHKKIAALKIQPGTRVSVITHAYGVPEPYKSEWEILEVLPDGMVKVLKLKGIGDWPSLKKMGASRMQSGAILDPSKLTKDMIVLDNSKI
jgi:hypothetical protein